MMTVERYTGCRPARISRASLDFPSPAGPQIIARLVDPSRRSGSGSGSAPPFKEGFEGGDELVTESTSLLLGGEADADEYRTFDHRDDRRRQNRDGLPPRGDERPLVRGERGRQVDRPDARQRIVRELPHHLLQLEGCLGLPDGILHAASPCDSSAISSANGSRPGVPAGMIPVGAVRGPPFVCAGPWTISAASRAVGAGRGAGRAAGICPGSSPRRAFMVI